MSIKLLLDDENGQIPTLSEESLAHLPKGNLIESEHLFHATRGLDDLKIQGWGVIVPESGGDDLLHSIAPLIAARAQEQALDPSQVRIYRTSKSDDPETWIRKNLPDSDRKRPRYLLILGDLDVIPFDLQRRLCDIKYYPGRLTFDQLSHYSDYAKKILDWEQPSKAAPSARVLMLTARTGDLVRDGVDEGYDLLMKPAFDKASASHDEGDDDYQFDLQNRSNQPPVSKQQLLDAAREVAPPTLLWTLSHGTVGNSAPEQTRATRGWLPFGKKNARERLSPQEVASGPFLPGGIWFMVACFGAGTPSRSAYWHWLKRLDEAGKNVSEQQFEHALSFVGSPAGAFVSALPKAALANPQGPLAILGHADLALAYAYDKLPALISEPVQRFLALPSSLASPKSRCRFGHATTEFRDLSSIDNQLAEHANKAQEAQANGKGLSQDEVQYALLWLHRQDLANYMLLGDPAARLPIQPG